MSDCTEINRKLKELYKDYPSKSDLAYRIDELEQQLEVSTGIGAKNWQKAAEFEIKLVEANKLLDECEEDYKERSERGDVKAYSMLTKLRDRKDQR